ncbi:helix-turn-helix domain-containing protein [Micromonospora sp. ALFpr18c]|uniref:helix-turn-helix domain-containing protein n=1 Tax=Micromonospora sp. ALFpr18c TaxID=1458665 RepID=UPI00124B84AC|nr:helix-turn-helix transcriptional regulator [Micromonospora sp. ALFpr18c]KAB1937743.1 helix-turn-helix domain-containing protein [Micromonospora sp. ALFpr18c]
MAQTPRQLSPHRSALHGFGAALRQWRERRGLSQRALGRLVHVSGDLIGKVEKAERWPSARFVESCEGALQTGGELVRFLADLESARRLTSVGYRLAEGAEGQLRALIDHPDKTDLLRSWHEQLASLAVAGNRTGYVGMASTAHAQIGVAAAVGRRSRSADRRDVLIVQALWAEFLSWIDEQGDAAEADAWLRRAQRHAVEANASTLASYVLMRQSQRALERFDPRNAAALAQRALDEVRLPGRIRALLLVRQAQAYAMGGDQNACAATINQAHRIAGRADWGSALPVDVGAHCDLVYVAAHEAQCRLLLGQPAAAADLYEQLLRQWPDQWRVDEALWRSALSTAYVNSGDVERAAVEATNALALATGTSSARALRWLNPTAVALRQQTAVPEAAAFVRDYRQATLEACNH